MGPLLEPVSEADESEATIVAGHRPLPLSPPVDPLGVEPAPVVRSLSPAASARPGASLLDAEATESPHRPAWVLPVALGIGALVIVIALALGAGAWFLGSGLEEEEALPAPTPTEPLPEPGGASPSVSPTATTEPAPVVAPEPPAPSVPAPPIGTEPAASPATTKAPAASSPAATKAPTVSPAAASASARPDPAPEDDAPVRISSRPASTTAGTSTTPAAPVAASSAPAPTAEASASAFYKLEFRSGDPSVESLEIKCSQGAGSGPTVTLEQVPRGNCRVTGRGGDAPLITLVTVVADRSYTCFAGRVPSCK